MDHFSSAAVCYKIEKILEISPENGNRKHYKVQWAPSWVSEIYLMGCDNLIKQFTIEKEENFNVSLNSVVHVKEEVETGTDQNDVVSTSNDGIDIFSDHIQKYSSVQLGVCEGLSLDASSSGVDNDCVGQINVNGTVGPNSLPLCDEIKVELDDLIETQSATNQENILVSGDFLVDNDTTVELRFVHPVNDGGGKDTAGKGKNSDATFLHHAKNDGGKMQDGLPTFIQHNLFGNSSKENNITKLHYKHDSTQPNYSKNSRNYSKYLINNKREASNPSNGMIRNGVDDENTREKYVNENSDLVVINDETKVGEIPSVTQHVQNKDIHKENMVATSSCENWNSPFSKSCNSAMVHFPYDKKITDTIQKENSFNNEFASMNAKLLDLSPSQYVPVPARRETVDETPDKALVTENVDFPTDRHETKCLETTFPCKICNILFHTKKSHDKHSMLIHNIRVKKSFNCTLCSKVFYGKNNLQRHIRVHTGERPYSCSFCGLEFSDYSNLKVHVRRRHTTERPHKCTLCMKKFATTCDLRKHIRTHTGERPFGCTVCNKGFKSSSHLAKHAKRCSTRI